MTFTDCAIIVSGKRQKKVHNAFIYGLFAKPANLISKLFRDGKKEHGTARVLESLLLEWYSEGAVPPTVTLPQS